MSMSGPTSMASVAPTKPTMQDIEKGFESSHQRVHGLHQRLAKIENAGDPLLPKTEEAEIKSNEKAHEESMEEKSVSVEESAFRLHFTLAARLALWVVFFGLPTFSEPISNWFFGDDASNNLCGPHLLGSWYEDADYQIQTTVRRQGVHGTLVPWSVAKASGITEAWNPNGGENHQVQCGHLPDIYLGYWPTVMQMTIFSAFGSCGNTIQLCWQGVMGTFFACANNVFLTVLFPHGINSSWQVGPLDPTLFFNVFGWVNFVAVTALFLLSKAATNTIKFGLSTHVCLMMGFMKPAGPNVGVHPLMLGFHWDDESVCWFLTALFGGLIAILAMLFPLPLLNITKVDDATQAYSIRMTKNMGDALNYLCGDEVIPLGKQIAAKILAGGELLTEVRNDIDSAWWECFDFGKPGRKRKLYDKLSDQLDTLRPLLFSARRCVLEEDFLHFHKIFYGDMLRGAMQELHLAAKNLTISVSMKCEDGDIDAKEKQELQKQVASVEAAQKKMVLAYIKSTAGLRVSSYDAEAAGTVRKDLGSEYAFMFSLASWGKREVEFTNSFLVRSRGIKEALKEGSMVQRYIVQPTKKTFNIQAMMEHEQRKYAFRNTLSIVTTFAMAMRFKSTLFTQYSYLMPMTLTMLITRVPAGTFAQSYQRIEGVSLGKILPIMFLSLVNIFPCDFPMNFYWHALAIFIYMLGFEYMSFSSVQFGSVGCLGAAYGCGFFFVRCVEKTAGSEAAYKAAQEQLFSDRYKEIGQIVGATVIMIIIDAFFREKPATDRATEALRAVKAKFDRAYKAFFNGETYLKDYHSEIVAAIEFAKVVAVSCDPKLQIAPGYTPPFRYNFFIGLFPLLETFASDFHMLMLATGTEKSRSSGEVSKAANDLVSQVVSNKVPNVNITSLQAMKENLFDEIDIVFKAALALLEHPSGEVVDDDPDMNKITKSSEMEAEEFLGTDDFVRDINSIKELHTTDSSKASMPDVTEVGQVRLQVALQALNAAKKSLNAIADLIVCKNVNL